jgi:ribosome recycling factor
MGEFTSEDFQRKMQMAIEALAKEFSGLRTGRASVALLDPVMVEAYGSSVPLNQVGTVSVSDARMLSVQVWDRGLVKAVEKAIRDAGLGLNPSADGQLVRVPMPELSQERRKELTKIAAKYAEQTRVAIRNVRREAMDCLKKMEKDGDISEDQHQRLSKDIQTLTDNFIKKVDDMLTHKEKDILQV